jgi:uncharacterized membrane protein YfcA
MTPQAEPMTGALLMAIAFLAGVGITAIGPGGIFLTIALLTLGGLSPASVAGTASAAMVAAALAGTVAYVHSGELTLARNRVLVVILSSAGLVGAVTGSWLNAFVSPAAFALLLGIVAFAAGAAIVYQEWRGLEAQVRLDVGRWAGRAVLALLGFAIGTASGLLGVGGPVMSVPTLVVLGVPILSAVAVAQAQSLPIAVLATAGYAARDAVRWPWVAALGMPLLLGVVTGWAIARRIDPGRLKLLLGCVLLALGPYLAF